LYYKVILPKDFDAAKEYPAVIAFPGGAQTMPMVDGMIARNLKLQADKHGYIVAVLSAPAAGRFYQGGAVVFPAFLDQLLADYKIRGGKFHLAGISNGGLSSFHIAASYPKYFWSVTGFPGYLLDATDERISALRNMCLNMHVGQLDEQWRRFPCQGHAGALHHREGTGTRHDHARRRRRGAIVRSVR
jgi:poly(3-hydroxybutyrate) depolymerase